ncbi:MAG TPA: PGPGW domain-containing protein [Candidatus Saccharimonadia bacterium]|nr:PGPGW domain-containing protein [Candidatus Saccharimonadia bacterium]
MKFLHRPVATVVGAALALAGLIMLVTPGPGLLTIVAGVAVWATEYRWARVLLLHLRERVRKLSQRRAG